MAGSLRRQVTKRESTRRTPMIRIIKINDLVMGLGKHFISTHKANSATSWVNLNASGYFELTTDARDCTNIVEYYLIVYSKGEIAATCKASRHHCVRCC